MIQENRLAYNLAFIESFKSERRWGWRRDRTKTKARARRGRESVHNGEPEIRADAPHLRQRDAERSCPADSFTAPGKQMIKKEGWRGEKERDN